MQIKNLIKKSVQESAAAADAILLKESEMYAGLYCRR